jgi:hypothetical protein
MEIKIEEKVTFNNLLLYNLRWEAKNTMFWKTGFGLENVHISFYSPVI